MKELRFILFIILITVFCFNVCAFELGVSKQEISLNSKTGEKICSKILVYSEDYLGNYIVKDLWLDEGNFDKKKKLIYYNLESMSWLKTNYDKTFFAKN